MKRLAMYPERCSWSSALKGSLRLSFMTAYVAITACSTSTGIPPSTAPDSRETVLFVGAPRIGAANLPGQYVVTLRRGSGTVPSAAYHFGSDVTIRHHYSRRQGDFIEFHGRNGATFIPSEQIDELSTVQESGVLRRISLSEITSNSTQRQRTDCLATSETNRRLATASCYDPGPCVDCSGPMAPGGWLSCSIVSHRICGGDADLGTGSGIGIFRSVDPLVSCQYDFSDGAYACDFDVDNSQSDAPADLSNGYEYNYTMKAALLHCKGPSANSTAFIVGKDPTRAVNVGIHNIRAGQSAAHAMFTSFDHSTTMNAQYFGHSLRPVTYVGWCTGSN
jgi:hypothetical protein